MKLFDAHCHLQDPRILSKTPHLIATAIETGVLRFAVNGVSEKDWRLVKELGERYPSVIPCFGLHPWFITERSPNWFVTLKEYFEATPSAAVGEIGLDKGSHGKTIDFTEQVEVFQKQLELAKELNRPASVHCVRAFGYLLEIMKNTGPFPAGVILHSYLGSPDMVPEFTKLGAYFSFSGFLMSIKEQKAKQMLKAVSLDRILLETDAPDALPNKELDSLSLVAGDDFVTERIHSEGENSASSTDSLLATSDSGNQSSSKETFNHPANIHLVLGYVASLLDTSKEELPESGHIKMQYAYSLMKLQMYYKNDLSS